MLKKIVTILIILMITVSFGGCGSEKEASVQANNTSVVQDELQEKEQNEQTVDKEETNNPASGTVAEKENGDSNTAQNIQSEVVSENTDEKETASNPVETQSETITEGVKNKSEVVFIAPNSSSSTSQNYCSIKFTKKINVAKIDVTKIALTRTDTKERLFLFSCDTAVSYDDMLIIQPYKDIVSGVEYCLYIPAGTIAFTDGGVFNEEINHTFINTLKTNNIFEKNIRERGYDYTPVSMRPWNITAEGTDKNGIKLKFTVPYDFSTSSYTTTINMQFDTNISALDASKVVICDTVHNSYVSAESCKVFENNAQLLQIIPAERLQANVKYCVYIPAGSIQFTNGLNYMRDVYTQFTYNEIVQESVKEQPSNTEEKKNNNVKKDLVTNTYFDPSRSPWHKDSQGNKIYYITPSKEYQSGNNYCTIGFGVDIVSFDVYQCSITNLETGEALPIRDWDSGAGATIGNCLIVTPDAKIKTNVKYALYIPANTVELSNGTFYDVDIYHEFVTTVDTRW